MLPALRDIDLLHIELRNKDNEDVRALLQEIERRGHYLEQTDEMRDMRLL